MRPAGPVVLALLLTGCGGDSGGGPAQGGVSPRATAELRVAGRWLVDGQGRAVILHGFNTINKIEQRGYLPSRMGFGADDADSIASQGFNTVRTGLIHKGFATAPGAYDRAYLEDLAATVKLLTDRKLYVLLDFHQDMYNERYQGEGFADWATYDSSPTPPASSNPNCMGGFPANMFTCEHLWEAFDRFFGINGHAVQVGPRGLTLQDEFAEAWQYVAARFADDPYVFGFNILNEPHPGSAVGPCLQPSGCPPGLDQKLNEFHSRVGSAIRAIDAETIIFYEPYATNFNAGMPTEHGELKSGAADIEQVGFSFHVYACPSSVSPVILPGDATASCRTAGEENVYANAGAQADAYGHAPLVTEFGATDDLATIQRIIDLADEHRMGWQYWAWWNEDPCCDRPGEGVIIDPSRPPTDDNLKQDKLDVLVRPYPRAVAGTPSSWSWDAAARRFELRYTTIPVSAAGLGPQAVTEIWVPRRHFPDGHRLDVTGGFRVSTPHAEAVQIRNVDGASEVTVVVTPP